MVYEDSAFIEELNESLCSTITSYLVNQVKAGANVVMLFDSWGGLLSYLNFPIYSLQYLKKIITRLNQNFPTTPKIVFVKGGGAWLESIVQTDCSGIGIDWTVENPITSERDMMESM